MPPPAATRRLVHVASALEPEPSTAGFEPSIAGFLTFAGTPQPPPPPSAAGVAASAATASREPWKTPGHPGFDGRAGLQLFDLTGKVAFITGSSVGLGAGMAVGLAQAVRAALLHPASRWCPCPNRCRLWLCIGEGLSVPRVPWFRCREHTS